MKVLLINGSSKANGYTYTALDEISKQLKKISKLKYSTSGTNLSIDVWAAGGDSFEGKFKNIYYG